MCLQYSLYQQAQLFPTVYSLFWLQAVAAMTVVISTFPHPPRLLFLLLATFGSIMKTANSASSDIVYGDLPSAAASALAADPGLQPLIDWYHANLPHHRDKETYFSHKSHSWVNIHERRQQNALICLPGCGNNLWAQT